jgi:hypothetical protein
MKARKLLAGAEFGPETLKVICKAFDDAWAEIRRDFDDNALSIEVARLKLASAILGVAKDDSRDPDELKGLGLQAMALRYRFDRAVDVVIRQRVRTLKYWRNYAEETLTLAEQMTDPECRRMLKGVAETYLQLARQAATEEADRANEFARRR